MKSYRIVLEYTGVDGYADDPRIWDWHTLLAISSDEAISVVSAELIDTPAAHLEDLNDNS